MKIRIKETGEIKDLEIIDPNSGCSWIRDLLGNHDAGKWINETEYEGLEMCKEEFVWWNDFCKAYESADFELHEALKEAPDFEEASELARKVRNEYAVDLEYEPHAMREATNAIKEKFELGMEL